MVRPEPVEAILVSSERIRDELAAAATRLDTYIEQLRIALDAAEGIQRESDPI